jgi:hypothetical protein
MNQISEQEFRDAIIATKKDTKLVAAARNDRINSPDSLHKEFLKLTVDRQREIIIAISNENFVGAQWKIGFPLNNLPAANVADAVNTVGKALFYTREEDSVKETVRAIRLYLESPFYKVITSSLGNAAEITGTQLYEVARILTEPEIYGLIQSLDSSAPASERIVQDIAKSAMYTKDFESTRMIAKFLYARRHSSSIDAVARLIENTIFMARDRRSVREILGGLGAGSVDHVLKRHAENRSVLSGIRDIAIRTRNSRAIRNYLEGL